MSTELRVPRKSDIGRIVALLNKASRAVDGVPSTSEAEVRLRLRSPTYDVERYARVAFRDDALVGYADLEPQGAKPTRCWLRFAASPHVELESVAPLLFEWAERQASREPEAVLRVYVSNRDEPLATAVAQRGFRLVRHSDRMQAELERAPAPPRWPEGIRVRTVRESDVRAVWETYAEVFADSWERPEFSFEEWAHWMLDGAYFDPGLWFLARAGDRLAGICLCRERQYEPDVAWVSVLGVRRPWRRVGLGRALLTHAFGELYRRGWRRVALGVDADSLTHADRLYESLGMRRVLRFDFYDKWLGGSPAEQAAGTG